MARFTPFHKISPLSTHFITFTPFTPFRHLHPISPLWPHFTPSHRFSLPLFTPYTPIHPFPSIFTTTFDPISPHLKVVNGVKWSESRERGEWGAMGWKGWMGWMGWNWAKGVKWCEMGHSLDKTRKVSLCSLPPPTINNDRSPMHRFGQCDKELLRYLIRLTSYEQLMC